MKAYKYLFLIFLLAGCVSLQKAETFDQRAAYTIGALQAVLATTSDLLDRGRITPKQAQEIANTADQGKEAVLVARSLKGADVMKAEDQLRIATEILTQLEKRLQEAQK